MTSGARNSTPCAAHSASTPRIRSRFATIGVSRRAPWAAIETWSSWLALVGVESVEHGVARCLFSLISAAVVTSAIMKPEFSPGARVRNGGRSCESVGSTISATRRCAIAPISATASAMMSAAKATGSA